MATWNDAAAVWNASLYQWDDAQFRPFPSLSSSSSGVITPRWRTPSSPSSVSTASVKSTPEPIVTVISTSSGSVTSRPVQKPSSVISSFSSGSSGLITDRTVDKPFAICSSASSSTSSNHIETQINPGAVASSSSASVITPRKVYEVVLSSSTLSSSGATVTLQNRPGCTPVSSSASVVTARYYLEPFPTIGSTSFNSVISENVYEPLPIISSVSSAAAISSVNAPSTLESDSSSKVNGELQFRGLPAPVETSFTSTPVRLVSRMLVSASSSSSASTVARMAYRSIPGGESDSSGIANTEGNIIRSFAVASSLSSESARATPVITLLISSSSGESALIRPVQRISLTASSLSNSGIQLPRNQPSAIASSSTVTQSDRLVSRVTLSISSSSSSIDNVEKVKRSAWVISSASSELVRSENLIRPIVSATSSSSSIFIYHDASEQRAMSSCISLSETDLYPAICSFIPALSSVSGFPFNARLCLPPVVWTGLTSAMGAVSTLVRPLPSPISSSTLNAVIESNLPAPLHSNSSVSLSPVIVNPIVISSGSSGVCILEKCLNPVPNVESDCIANVYTGVVYPVTYVANSIVSDTPRNVLQPGAILSVASEVDLTQEYLKVPAIPQFCLSSLVAECRLQIEEPIFILSSTASTVVVRHLANARPFPMPQSSSNISRVTSIVTPISGKSLSSCITTTRWRALVLSITSTTGSVVIKTVYQPITQSISATACSTMTESVIRTRASALSSSELMIQSETSFNPIPQCYASSGGVFESKDAYEIEATSQSASVCNANVNNVNQSQPQMSSSTQVMVPDPVHAEMEIIIQLETDSGSDLFFEQTNEFMVQAECDSVMLVNIEVSEAVFTEMLAEADSFSSSYLVLRSLITFEGASINSAAARVVMVPSVSNDQEEITV